MVFGIFRSVKKSTKLVKISRILSDVSMDFDMNSMFKKSREKEKAIEDLIELAFEESAKKPYFLEIHSYRLLEHCGHKIDKSIRRLL